MPRVGCVISQQVFVNRGCTLPRPAPAVDTAGIVAGTEIEGSDCYVRSAEAVHVQPFLDLIAYRLETEAGSIVITGDTEPCDSVVELARASRRW